MRNIATSVLLALAANVPACAGWSDPVRIDLRTGTSYSAPRVAAGDDESSGFAVVGYRRPGGATRFVESWTSLQSIVAGKLHGLAASRLGTALVVAHDGTTTHFDGSAWRESTPLGAALAGWPGIGADADGNFVAAWPAENGAVQAARNVGGGNWEPIVNIGAALPPERVESVRVAVNATGVTIVAWCETRAGGAAVMAHVLPPAGSGGATELGAVPACVVSPNPEAWPNVSTLDVGITDLGVPTVVWSSGGRVVVRRAVPGGAWRPTEALGGSAAINPKVAVNPARGDNIVAWKESGGAVHARSYSAASGRWTADTTVGGGGANPSLAVGIDGRGRGMVAFPSETPRLPSEPPYTEVTAVRFNNGSWFESTVAATRPLELDMAMADDGEAFLVWTSAQAGALEAEQRALWGAVYTP